MKFEKVIDGRTFYTDDKQTGMYERSASGMCGHHSWFTGYRELPAYKSQAEFELAVQQLLLAEELKELPRKLEEKVRQAIVGFAPGSGNAGLAKLILDTIGVEGASAYFFTGGGDSEPEGAGIEIPGMPGRLEVVEATRLVNWAESTPGHYCRTTGGSYASTQTYRLSEAGDVV